LQQISKISPEFAEIELRTIIDERESNITFNTSALEDINEKILTEARGMLDSEISVEPQFRNKSNSIGEYSRPHIDHKFDSLLPTLQQRFHQSRGKVQLKQLCEGGQAKICSSECGLGDFHVFQSQHLLGIQAV
jgi:hypothetical protein